MPGLSDGRAVADRAGTGAHVRSRGQVEAEITRGMIRFERERMGRGPADIRTRIVQDMVIVRMTDVLTPAEHALIRAGHVELLKQVRMKLLESEREMLNGLLREATGCEVSSLYSDICPRTGERLIVFILSENPEARWQAM